MGIETLDIRTNDALLNALKLASSLKQSHRELLEQRASFIYGSMDPESSITKAHIKRVLEEQDGSQGKI